MKKLLSIFAATILLTAGLFTSCSSEDDISAPTDTWVEKDYTYKDSSNNESQLTCYFMYSESGYSNSSLKKVPEASQNGSATTIKPGLTVVIVPSASASSSSTPSSLISALTSTGFICKTFTNGDNTETDSNDSTSFSFSMSATKWNLFYYANVASFAKNDQLKNPPTPLKTDGYTCIDASADSIKNLFSWKRLLANYLLGSL